jgi:hypothetical protein
MISGDFDYSIVESTAHRPWSLPHAPWLMTQSWHDLLFAHGVSVCRRCAEPSRRRLTSISSTVKLGWESCRST